MTDVHVVREEWEAKIVRLQHPSDVIILIAQPSTWVHLDIRRFVLHCPITVGEVNLLMNRARSAGAVLEPA